MLRNHEDGFTGLEAAIVLIAFVVVAAVFSYVVLGAGFFTTQKAQETVYKAVEQSTTNILIKGGVYGFAGGQNLPITQVNMTLAVAPGAPSIDITNMRVIYSNATISPVTMRYTAGTPTVNQTFYATSSSISGDDQVTIMILVPVGAPPNSEMNFELRPAGGGAPIPITKQVPPYTTTVNVLR